MRIGPKDEFVSEYVQGYEEENAERLQSLGEMEYMEDIMKVTGYAEGMWTTLTNAKNLFDSVKTFL